MAYPTKKKFVPKKKESKFRRYARKGRKVLKTTAQVAADVARLSAAVAYMGARLNVEKKYLDKDVITSSVGQVYGTAATGGWIGIDVTPDISQGVGREQRTGNSLKFTGMSFPIQFSGQSQCMAERKLKVMLFRVNSADNGVSIGECLGDYFDVNPLTGLYDFNSPKAYRNHKNDGIKMLRTKVYTLKAPTIVGGGATSTSLDQAEQSGFTCKFNVKLNDIIRYREDSHLNPDGTRYYLYIMCDKGNNHHTTVATADVPVTEVSTGVSYRLSQRSWWVDN